MSKKTWLLLILILAVVIYFVASKLYPSVDPWMADNVGSRIWASFISVRTTITSSAVWQSYGYWITFGVGAVGAVLVYRWLRVKKLRWGIPSTTKTAVASSIKVQREPAEPEQAPIPPVKPKEVAQPTPKAEEVQKATA